MTEKIEAMKAMEQFSITAVVTVFPDDIKKGIMYQLYRVMERGGHMLGVMNPLCYADQCMDARMSKFEIRDKMDFYRSDDKLPADLFDYLVTMVKMPEKNCVLDPFPELTGGKVKAACDKLGIKCVELK